MDFKTPQLTDKGLDYQTYHNVVQEVKRLVMRTFNPKDFNVSNGAVSLAHRRTLRTRTVKITEALEAENMYAAVEQVWNKTNEEWTNGNWTWGATTEVTSPTFLPVLATSTVSVGSIVSAYETVDTGNRRQWIVGAPSQAIPAKITGAPTAGVYPVDIYADGVDSASTGTGGVVPLNLGIDEVVPVNTWVVAHPNTYTEVTS
jgi:hypothetical protein